MYGDYFNPDTRTILNILMYSGITPKLIFIDTLQDSTDRKKYKQQENPADALPMVVHGKFKIISNIQYILKYLENTFPSVKEQLFDSMKTDKYDKLIKWHQKNLKP